MPAKIQVVKLTKSTDFFFFRDLGLDISREIFKINKRKQVKEERSYKEKKDNVIQRAFMMAPSVCSNSCCGDLANTPKEGPHYYVSKNNGHWRIGRCNCNYPVIEPCAIRKMDAETSGIKYYHLLKQSELNQ